MNAIEFAALLTIASAPVLEPETYTIEATPLGKETARHIRYGRQPLADRMAAIHPHRSEVETDNR